MNKLIIDALTFDIKDTENVLSALERHNYADVFVGCRHGGCGLCKIQIIAGNYDLLKMSAEYISNEDIENKIALACCVIPKTDLKIKILGGK